MAQRLGLFMVVGEHVDLTVGGHGAHVQVGAAHGHKAVVYHHQLAVDIDLPVVLLGPGHGLALVTGHQPAYQHLQAHAL